MTFKSGRTQPQGEQPYVLEDGKLYVTPQRFWLMNKAMMENVPADRQVFNALVIAGMTHEEAHETFNAMADGHEVEAVVDHELRQPAVRVTPMEKNTHERPSPPE